MEAFFITVTVFLVVIIALPLFRVLSGPTVFDRLLAISTMGSKTIGLICFFGISFRALGYVRGHCPGLRDSEFHRGDRRRQVFRFEGQQQWVRFKVFSPSCSWYPGWF